MTTEASGVSRQAETQFWRDFPSMVDYFAHSVTTLQNYVGMNSKEVMFHLGQVFGNKVGEKLESLSFEELLSELSRIWEKFEIGVLTVNSGKQLVITISNCTVCGQLAGTGGMFECAFHEGFFQSLLSTKLHGPVKLRQDTNYEGAAGTWCRRYVADIPV